MNTELLVIWTIINACWSIGLLVAALCVVANRLVREEMS